MCTSITGLAILALFSLGVDSSCVPEWKLVFVAVSGNGQSVYNRWRERLPDGCCEMKNGCLPEKASLAFTSPPRKHLKSPLVDKWKTLGIKKVKVELFKDGLRKVFLVFNGKGSDSMSWFSKSRLLTDSWEDLYKGGTFNYFSIKGSHKYRKFLISHQYGGCPKDAGWMVVVDKYEKLCSWDKHNAYPAILFGRGEKTYWDTLKFEKADYMVIYVETS